MMPDGIRCPDEKMVTPQHDIEGMDLSPLCVVLEELKKGTERCLVEDRKMMPHVCSEFNMIRAGITGDPSLCDLIGEVPQLQRKCRIYASPTEEICARLFPDKKIDDGPCRKVFSAIRVDHHKDGGETAVLTFVNPFDTVMECDVNLGFNQTFEDGSSGTGDRTVSVAVPPDELYVKEVRFRDAQNLSVRPPVPKCK